MAFFDDLQSRILQAGDAAAQKTKELTETSRLRAAITSENKAIQETYSQIGQVYFTKFADDPDPDLANLCQRILEAKQNIQKYEEQILNIKNEIECSNCHARLPKGTVFCNQCGARLSYDGTAQPSAEQSAPSVCYCPECGSPNDPATNFCTECGSKLHV